MNKNSIVGFSNWIRNQKLCAHNPSPCYCTLTLTSTRMFRNYLCMNSLSLWRRKWQPTPVFLPGESHRRRSLASCSPWVCKELDVTGGLSIAQSNILKMGEGSSMALVRKNPLDGRQETCVQSLDQQDSLEVEMAALSSIFAWRIPWTEEPDWLQSIGSQRVGHN